MASLYIRRGPTIKVICLNATDGISGHTLNHGDGWETNLWAADLQQVDGFSADVDIVGDVSQEDGHAVLHILGDQSVALHPEVLVCRDEEVFIAHSSSFFITFFSRSRYSHLVEKLETNNDARNRWSLYWAATIDLLKPAKLMLCWTFHTKKAPVMKPQPLSKVVPKPLLTRGWLFFPLQPGKHLTGEYFCMFGWV